MKSVGKINLHKSYLNLKQLLANVSDNNNKVTKSAIDLSLYQEDKREEINNTCSFLDEEDFLDNLEYAREIVEGVYENTVVNEEADITKFSQSLNKTITYLIEEKEGEFYDA